LLLQLLFLVLIIFILCLIDQSFSFLFINLFSRKNGFILLEELLELLDLGVEVTIVSIVDVQDVLRVVELSYLSYLIIKGLLQLLYLVQVQGLPASSFSPLSSSMPISLEGLRLALLAELECRCLRVDRDKGLHVFNVAPLHLRVLPPLVPYGLSCWILVPVPVIEIGDGKAREEEEKDEASASAKEEGPMWCK